MRCAARRQQGIDARFAKPLPPQTTRHAYEQPAVAEGLLQSRGACVAVSANAVLLDVADTHGRDKLRTEV